MLEPSSTGLSLLNKVLVEEIRPVITKKYEFEYRHQSTETNVVYFSDSPDSDAKNQLTEISIQSYCLSAKYLTLTIGKEIKQVNTEKHFNSLFEMNQK